MSLPKDLTDVSFGVGRPGKDRTVRCNQGGGALASQIGPSQHFLQVQGFDDGGDHASEFAILSPQLPGNREKPSAALATLDRRTDEHPVKAGLCMSLKVVTVTQVQRVGRTTVLVKQHVARGTDQHISSDQGDMGN